MASPLCGLHSNSEFLPRPDILRDDECKSVLDRKATLDAKAANNAWQVTCTSHSSHGQKIQTHISPDGNYILIVAAEISSCILFLIKMRKTDADRVEPQCCIKELIFPGIGPFAVSDDGTIAGCTNENQIRFITKDKDIFICDPNVLRHVSTTMWKPKQSWIDKETAFFYFQLKAPNDQNMIIRYDLTENYPPLPPPPPLYSRSITTLFSDAKEIYTQAQAQNGFPKHSSIYISDFSNEAKSAGSIARKLEYKKSATVKVKTKNIDITWDPEGINIKFKNASIHHFYPHRGVAKHTKYYIWDPRVTHIALGSNNETVALVTSHQHYSDTIIVVTKESIFSTHTDNTILSLAFIPGRNQFAVCFKDEMRLYTSFSPFKSATLVNSLNVLAYSHKQNYRNRSKNKLDDIFLNPRIGHHLMSVRMLSENPVGSFEIIVGGYRGVGVIRVDEPLLDRTIIPVVAKNADHLEWLTKWAEISTSTPTFSLTEQAKELCQNLIKTDADPGDNNRDYELAWIECETFLASIKPLYNLDVNANQAYNSVIGQMNALVKAAEQKATVIPSLLEQAKKLCQKLVTTYNAVIVNHNDKIAKCKAIHNACIAFAESLVDQYDKDEKATQAYDLIQKQLEIPTVLLPVLQSTPVKASVTIAPIIIAGSPCHTQTADKIQNDPRSPSQAVATCAPL